MWFRAYNNNQQQQCPKIVPKDMQEALCHPRTAAVKWASAGQDYALDPSVLGCVIEVRAQKAVRVVGKRVQAPRTVQRQGLQR